MDLRRILINKHSRLLLLLPAFLYLNSCNDATNSDDIKPIDHKPTAANDTLTVNVNSIAGVANQVIVSKNDVIGEDGGDGDDYGLSSEPANGKVTEVKDGVFEYIPNRSFRGNDSFAYVITDKDGDKATATVSVTIKAVEPSKSAFENIDPSQPSFVSIINTTPDDKVWVKLEGMSDEFDSWNNTKWFKSTWNYGIPVFMSTSNDNSGVSGGNLWIKPTLNESNTDGRWFQTARIHSRTKTSYPMYTEARIKAAHISAYNTYWLNNGDINNRDEIDIIENNSNPSCDCQPDFPLQMNSQYFHADSGKTPGTIRNASNFNQSGLSNNNPLKGVKWNEDYHTFGVWWKDEKNIQFYLDGEPAGSVTVGQDRSGKTYDGRIFTRDLEIIFDLWTAEATWLGGLAQKADVSNNAINTMKIDWVRTWKLADK